MPRSASTALGFSVHTGWASLVAIAGPAHAPQVIDRRRVELLDGPHADKRRFLYHAAAELPLDGAKELVDRTTAAVQKATLAGLRAALADLNAGTNARVGILGGGKGPPGTLETILASHAAIHAAEGHLYRQAIDEACRQCRMPVALVAARDAVSRLAGAVGLSAGEIESHLASMRARVGAPWGQDQKLAMLAAWCALAAPAKQAQTRASGAARKKR